MPSDDHRTFLSPRLRRRLLLGLGVAALVSLVMTGLRATPALEVAEAKSYDLRSQWLVDPGSADTSIVIVAIDENSLEVYSDDLGRWPWDRDAYAPIIEYATAGGARAVVFDITFTEPNRGYPEGDTIFADALRQSGIGILAFTLDPGDADEAAEWLRNRARDDSARVAADRQRLVRNALQDPPDAPDAGRGAPEFQYARPPIPVLARSAHSLGAINWSPDRDGVSRRQRLVVEHPTGLQPSLPLAAARLLDPERYGGSPTVSDERLTLGETHIPLDAGRLVIRWRGPYLRGGETTFDVIPAFHVLDSWKAVYSGHDPAVPLEAFEGKTVLIAATSAGAFETRSTPVSSLDPGVMIHATILDNLLQGDFLRRAGTSANLAILLGAVLLAALLGVLFDSAVIATVGAALTLVAAGAIATWALAQGVWLDMAAPILGGSLAFAGVMVGNYLTEGREKRRVRELFGRYVSPDYVSRLADDYENVKLGGARVPVTLLFSDIRGFTSLSERLDPEMVIEMLNEYLDRMAEVVFRHGGTLDKFIGDAVMAFWNAPIPVEDHARRAVEAALDMMEELEALNERWEAAGAPAQLQIGIGVNTGEAIVGNIGSLTRKLDYTAIGDAVNLAARLEGLNKEYGSSIIVSEGTLRELSEEAYELRPIDEVKVKGKEKAVRIYELKGRRSKEPTGRRSGLVTASLIAGLLALGATGVSAQEEEKARWTDWVYQPGTWQGGSVVEYVTRDPATDSLALVARVDLFSLPPRWRAEFRTVVNPDSMGPPVVVVADGDKKVVLTQLGSTPFEEHAAAEDPVIDAVLRIDGILRGEDGSRPVPAGPTRAADREEDGRVRYVVVRRPAARAEFETSILSTGSVGRLGRSMARLGMHAVGGERSEEVVASAGARGVATVQTVDGEITVMPDTAAIQRMVAARVGIIDLDRFLREGGIRSVPLETPREEEGL